MLRARTALLLPLALLALLAGRAQVRAQAAPPPLLPLQPLIDAAAPGAVVAPPAGRYAGPVTITRAITLDGSSGVTIDAGGKGTVLTLATDGATVRNLHLTGSGDSFNDIDAGIQVRGRHNVMKDNRIEGTLFGIDLQQSDANIVRRNRIRSKPVELGQRGDAIRLWYSNGNQVVDNDVADARDMVIWYSRDNVISRNRAVQGRYALHFMYSQGNRVEENQFSDNAVGVFLMYSDGVVLRDNTIRNATGTTGVGIGFKESSEVVVERNRLLYCATGIYLDVSPFQPETRNRFEENLIAYSSVAVQFHSDWTGNEFTRNRFVGNITQVAVNGARSAARNRWEGNFWDDYQGFDNDGDGIGDTPHELFSYADRIWMDVPSARFYKGSPVLEVVDFLERLAPFSPPVRLLNDPRPLLEAPS